jgi:hypothetical protein
MQPRRGVAAQEAVAVQLQARGLGRHARAGGGGVAGWSGDLAWEIAVRRRRLDRLPARARQLRIGMRDAAGSLAATAAALPR